MDINRSQKRKSDGGFHPPPPAKKFRPQNGHQVYDRRTFMASRGRSIASNQEPRIPRKIPTLPTITPEYEAVVFTHQSAVSRPTTNSHNTDVSRVQSPDQVSSPSSPKYLISYDRLEWLGDSYIESMASRLLHSYFSSMDAGRLSQTRESLVKNSTLAEFSAIYGFPDRLRIKLNDVNRFTKIMGDVFEAYVAAVVHSDPVNGFEAAEDWLTELWLPKLQTVDAREPNLQAKEELARMVLTPVSKLHYLAERSPGVTLQNDGSVGREQGKTTRRKQMPKGFQEFRMGVYFTGWDWERVHLGSGTGLNKVIAGNEAASMAMDNYQLIDKIVTAKKRYLEEKAATNGSSETHDSLQPSRPEEGDG